MLKRLLVVFALCYAQWQKFWADRAVTKAAEERDLAHIEMLTAKLRAEWLELEKTIDDQHAHVPPDLDSQLKDRFSRTKV